MIVRLPAGLVRRARAVTGPSAAYRDLAELIELALLNQLELDHPEGDPASGVAESRDPRVSPGDDVPPTELPAVLKLPSTPPATVDPSPVAGTAPLSPFTNRLFPVKLCCRVLANLSGPSLAEFQQAAAEAARALGLRLKEGDRDSRRQGLDRRWVALPVGRKGKATTNRFINHFSFTTTREGAPSGPMAILGLAGPAEGGHVALTSTGAELACAHNPILDDERRSETTLGEEERRILLAAITENPLERDAVARFAEIVEKAEGVQQSVDDGVRSGFGVNTQSQATAIRAAIVGRLHDLRLLTVTGSGPRAQINIEPGSLIGLGREEER